MDKQTLVRHADDNSFEDLVLKSGQPVLVDFWAPWCGPCRALAHVLDEIAGEYDGRLRVVKVNVDESPGIARRYRVMSIPTIMLVQGGELRETRTGLVSRDRLSAMVDNVLER